MPCMGDLEKRGQLRSHRVSLTYVSSIVCGLFSGRSVGTLLGDCWFVGPKPHVPYRPTLD